MEIAQVAESADRFGNWLVREAPGGMWTEDNLRLPDMHRWTVSWICYERLFEELWSERWFQDGIRAFGLLALEMEGKIELLRQDDNNAVHVRCPEGIVTELDTFLRGETLPIRHDPEYSDLSWVPVRSMGHLLRAYDE